MKWLVWTIGFFLLLGCHEEDKTEVTATLEEQYNLYVTTSNQIVDYIISKNPTIDEVIAYAESLNTGIQAEQKNGILYLTDAANYTFAYDITGVCVRSASDISDEELLAMVEENSEVLSALGDKDQTANSGIEAVPSAGSRSQGSLNAGANNISKEVPLVRRNVLLWSPWEEFTLSDRKTIQSIITSINGNKDKKGKVKSFEVINGARCTPSSISKWGDYDLVIVSAHGTPEGELVIPRMEYDYRKEETTYGALEKKGYSYRSVFFNPNTKREENAIFLKKEAFKEMLPSMSKSIVWSSVCYAFPSTARGIETWMNALVEKECPAFYGTDSVCSNFGTLKMLLNGYMLRLFAGASTALAFKNAAKSNIYHEDNYFDCIDPGNLKYKYYGYNWGKVYFPEVLTLPSSQRQRGKGQYPLSRVTLPKQYVGSRAVSSGVKSFSEASSPINEFGIYVQPVGSGNGQYIPFLPSSVSNYQSVDYLNLITRTFVECNIPDLISGMEYKYQAYMRIDGQLILDDNSYTFIATEEGEGEDNNVFEIRTADDLYQMRLKCQTEEMAFNGWRVILMNDITIDGFEQWPLIDFVGGCNFCGTFEGNNHQLTINIGTYDLEYCKDSRYESALFGANIGIIKDLKINFFVDNTDWPFHFVSLNRGTLSNCEVEVNVKHSSFFICGINQGIMERCMMKGSAKGCYERVSLCATMDSDGLMDSCINYLSFTYEKPTHIVPAGYECRDAYSTIAPICCCFFGGTVRNCSNYGNYDFYDQYYIGGICGYSGNYEALITDCHNYGKLTVIDSKCKYIGGICGNNRSRCSIRNCTNKGDVTVTYSSYAGGIAGYNSGNIKFCINEGNLYGSSKLMAGLCAINNASISQSTNKGSLHINAVECNDWDQYYVVGLYCLWGENTSVSDCNNSGRLIGSDKISCWVGNVLTKDDIETLGDIWFRP